MGDLDRIFITIVACTYLADQQRHVESLSVRGIAERVAEVAAVGRRKSQTNELESLKTPGMTGVLKTRHSKLRTLKTLVDNVVDECRTNGTEESSLERRRVRVGSGAATILSADVPRTMSMSRGLPEPPCVDRCNRGIDRDGSGVHLITCVRTW